MVSSFYSDLSDETVREGLRRNGSLIHTVKALPTIGIFCEAKVILANLGGAPIQRAALEVGSLDETVRGSGGFGSTGI